MTLFATMANLPLEFAPFLMLKVIYRMEFGWNQKKGKGKRTEKGKKMKRCEVPIPSINIAKATHAERASDRLDAQTPRTVIVSVSIYYVLLDSHNLCRTHETSMLDLYVMLPCLYLPLTCNHLSHSTSRSPSSSN